jgi:PAS domain S-box-containing protein
LPRKNSEETTLRPTDGKHQDGQPEVNPALAEELKQFALLQARREELEIRNEKLQRERDRFEELYETGPSAHITINSRSGKIIEMNLSATDLLKVNRSQAYRRKFAGFLEPEFGDMFNIFSNKALSDPYRGICEVKMRRQEGSVFWALLDIRGEPKLNQIRIAITDITERKQVEQIKDDFIGMVSHELRTPLTVIMGSVNVALSPGITSKEMRELLEQASASSESLSHILDNLIELSRYQSNRLELTREPTDVDDFIRETVQLESGHYKRRIVSIELSRELPHSMFVDRIRFRQIISNLLDNAAKYSPAGTGIKISVKPEGEYLCIGVHDQGTGISTEDQARLFEPFERLREKSTTNPGLGLGLLVCRRLIEAHGGKIWVESARKKGSTFWFTIPVNGPPLTAGMTRK